MMFFTIIYIHKEKIEGPENDDATRKSHVHIDWVRDLGLLMCKEDPPNMYKIEFAKETAK
jgi:hypothetical protein